MSFNTTRWTLIDAAKRGEQSAFDQLVERYRPPVVGYLRRCGCSPSDAEDLAQEVFLRLYRRVLLTAEAERGRFRGLLVAVTRSVVHEHWRRGKAEKRGGKHARVPLEGVDPALPPESTFDREWLSHLLGRALARLEREHANYHGSLCAVLLDELTYAQVAEREGKKVSDVRNHVYRGKQKVIAYLRAEVQLYAAGQQEHETEMQLLSSMLREP